MKYILLAALSVIGCAPEGAYMCGISNRAPEIPEDVICAAVGGVQVAYPEADVENVLDGIPLEVGQLAANRFGECRIRDRLREDKIVLRPGLAPEAAVHILAHELIHIMQDRWDGATAKEIMGHACPWFSPKTPSCGGAPSYSEVACDAALTLFRAP
jgi:hypothetical protein